jgi:uncharacterized protein (DUF1501 family)
MKPIKQEHIICSAPEHVENLTRRCFLRTGVSLTGYVSLAKLLGGGRALGQEQSYTPQRNLVWINMQGGWDILEVTDPKLSSTNGITMSYSWDEAARIAGAADEARIGRWLPNIAALGNELLVVRGLAMGTTSHQAGNVYMDTGILSNAGRVNAASIPAIVASESGATIPIIQLNGGSDPQIDRGLLNPVSVVRASNLNLYQSMYPSNAAAIEQKLTMMDYLQTSLGQLREEVGESDRITALTAAEEKVRGQFVENVGSKLVLTTADRAPFQSGAPTGMNSGLSEAFALALKLIKSDLVTCINLGVGGFDTHANQSARLQPILANVDFALNKFVLELAAAGKLNNTLIVLYSDFGRTPRVNNSNGRDHWPVGGALMLGGGIAGGRIVGATDDDLRAVSVNTDTGVADEAGVQLNPTHLGGSVLALTLGEAYLSYRPYLSAVAALTRLRA